MFEYFYHEIMRRTIISFGSIFNNVNIQHDNSDGSVVSTTKVPLAYGPTQKFLARLEQVPDLNRPVQISLPRMSFELNGLSYDPSRKSTTTQTFLKGVKGDKKTIAKTYLPVPYNLDFATTQISQNIPTYATGQQTEAPTVAGGATTTATSPANITSHIAPAGAMPGAGGFGGGDY